MEMCLKRIITFTFLTAFVALCLTFNPLSTHLVHAESYKLQMGTTITWTNIQTDTMEKSTVVSRNTPHTKVIMCVTISGQTIWHDISNWYRVSSFNSLPLYIYNKLSIAKRNSRSACITFRSIQREKIIDSSKLIVVSISQDQLYAYQGGKKVFSTQVITGRSALPTPIGIFHIFEKLKNITFYSPWPKGSPYWYMPTHINYALGFLHGGYFLHDSWWHTVYGPGTSGWHHDPVYGWQWGTHGCVAMATSAASWLYKWAPIGLKVQINK